MPYTKTTWVDEIPASTPVKYQVVDDVLGEVAGSAAISVVTTITTPGTAVNAANLNKIEAGIESATDTAESAEATADAAAIVADSAFLYALPVLYAVKTTEQSIPGITYTNITGWSAAVVTAGGMEFNSTTGVITFPAGKYIARFQGRFFANATGGREIGVPSGANIITFNRITARAIDGMATTVTGDIHIVVASSLSTAPQAWQNSGGALTLAGASIEVRRIGD